jgi:hypothetical protein
MGGKYNRIYTLVEWPTKISPHRKFFEDVRKDICKRIRLEREAVSLGRGLALRGNAYVCGRAF